MVNTKEIVKRIEQTKARSAWAKAVKDDAIEMLTDLEKTEFKDSQHLLDALLNGAYGNDTFSKWLCYSDGGCALIYNYDIAKHYCTSSEFKKCKEGLREPNKNESWLDVQARGLYQSWLLIESNIA